MTSKRIAKAAREADIIVTVRSERGTEELLTTEVYDRRISADWPEERIKGRGITGFSSLRDLKETLNWCLACNEDRYAFQWVIVGREYAVGKAYLANA